MQLSDEDLKIIRRAARDERLWRYARLFELACWSGLVIFGFWLIEQPDYLESKLLRNISLGMCSFGGVGLGMMIHRWNNKERQLLLRLTSTESQAPG